MDATDITGTRNLQWAILLIQALVDQGVTRFVISPGSRSTPLALAISRNRQATYRVIVDERSAAFFALGQGRQTGVASALVCTSGTAVANWLPAVVEANHAAVPLLLLSADRPPELHNRGANQTIAQANLFGEQVRRHYTLSPPDEILQPRSAIQTLVHPLMTALYHPIPGPVHLNIPFREPLLPLQLDSVTWQITPFPQFDRQPVTTDSPDISHLCHTFHQRRGLILCGEGVYSRHFYPLVTQLAERLDCPLLLDPLSNLRWGYSPSSRVVTYDEDSVEAISRQGLSADWVIQFGDFPLSKGIARWLQQSPPTQFITVQHQRCWSDPYDLSTETLQCSPEQFCEKTLEECSQSRLPEWIEPLIEMEQNARQWEPSTGCLTEVPLLQWLGRALPDSTVMFSGNSMVIRDIDRWLPVRQEQLTLHANRGASGIDGNLSTVCGICSTVPPQTPVIALLGDVALFHDLNALSIAREAGDNLTLVVINNGGGAIFSYLPPAQLPEFEPLWLTPPNIDLEKAAALYGIRYQRITHQDQLPKLSLTHHQPLLIEYVVDRQASMEAHLQYREFCQ